MTSFGISNNGQLRFDYYHEDLDYEPDDGWRNDIVGDSYVYNGYDSVLWVNFAKAFAKEIRDLYATWRTGKNALLTYDKVVDNFITNHANQWPIAIYNEDAEFKYIKAFRDPARVTTHLYQVKGTGAEHLKYFIKNRLMYCDSKWKTGDFSDKANAIILRLNEPKITDNALKPESELVYKTFSNMYAGVAFGSSSDEITSKYTPRDTEVKFKLPKDQSAADLDVYIFGADQVSSLLDLSLLYCASINVSAATKLTQLIVGKAWYTKDGVEHRYTNNSLTELSLTNNRLLKELNICNCTALATQIDLSLCPDIQKVYAEGSSITSVVLPSAGFLQEMSLPSTIRSLMIENQNRLTSFTCQGYQNLTHITIRNSSMVSTGRFPLQSLLDQGGCNPDNINSLVIENIHWDIADVQTDDRNERAEDILENIITTLIGLKNAGVPVTLTGSVHLPKDRLVDREIKTMIHNYFPDLNVIDAEEGFFVDYLNYDTTVFRTEFVAAGQPAPRPDTDPEDIKDYEFGRQYIFVDWLNLPTKVTSNCVVTAQWQTKYAVTFLNEDGTQIDEPFWYNAYERPEDPIAAGKMEEPTLSSGSTEFRYKFNGWQGMPETITGPITVQATFIKEYPVRFYNEGKLHATQWVKEGHSTPMPTTPTKALDDQYTYQFSRWSGSGDLTNVHGTMSFEAIYSPTERQYTVHFYNDNEHIYTPDKPVSYTRSLSPENIYSSTNIKKKINGIETDDYICQGWYTQLDSEKSEIKYSAIFRYQAYLKDEYGNYLSWQTIIDDVENLSIDAIKAKYPIGSQMLLTFAGEDGTATHTVSCEGYGVQVENMSVAVELIAYAHDDKDDKSGKAALTFFCKELPKIYTHMKDSTGSYTGWTNSQVYSFLNQTLFGHLTSDLKSNNGIKSVIKKSDTGQYKSTELVDVSAKLWLASTREIGMADDNNVVPYQGELYSETFDFTEKPALANSKRRKLIPTNDGYTNLGGSWATRSSMVTTNNMYYIVNSTGARADGGSWYQIYIPFGFCI